MRVDIGLPKNEYFLASSGTRMWGLQVCQCINEEKGLGVSSLVIWSAGVILMCY